MTVSLIWARTAFVGPRPWVFLAGPTPRHISVPSWRPNAVRSFVSQWFNGTLIIPEDGTGEPFDEERYTDPQIDWEWDGLGMADCIMFWVPRNMETLPGLTTNVEFGMYASSGKVVLGYPPSAEKVHYLDRLARDNDVKVSVDLDQTVKDSIDLARSNYSISLSESDEFL